MSYLMLMAVLALYAFMAAVCAAIAVRMQHRRYSGDFLAYFVVGVLGAWVGGAMWGSWGWLLCGVSVAATAIGAAVVVDINFLITQAAGVRYQAETKTFKNGLKTQQFEDVAHGTQ